MSTVSIRPISRDDTDNIVRWRNRADVKLNLFSQADTTPESHLRWMETMVDTHRCHQFIIELDGRAVGTSFLKNIDPHSRKAEFGIFIGEPEARGKGVGTQATRLTVDYGFITLGLNRIFLEVFSLNSSAIAAYQKVGFVKEGVLKEDYMRQGIPFDVTVMAILAKDAEND
ncbi:MAG: UDP-4-amino-4,6-dideoxy-N-acetyl-beta-L-altrosamine N-acetyltransferase [Eubacteriales bacterium]|nr:UDP-4-amino-4,6-dideoxy-N-acetyl-beta-L-altrosamine N-acetyltransferase [Eubacteriales bacterium]